VYNSKKFGRPNELLDLSSFYSLDLLPMLLMKKSGKLKKSFSIIFMVLGLLPIDNLPVNATHREVNGCGDDTGLGRFVPNAPTGADFRPSCDNHDRCYGTLGKSKSECDKQFHNELLGVCGRTFRTIITRPLRGVCNKVADVYYTAVLESGNAGTAYNKAQRHAQEEATQPLCYNVDSRNGWQYIDLPRSVRRVVSVGGSWSVDARNYSGVGPEGHSGDAARRLEPYNQYKYDQGIPFGGLLVDIPTDGNGYVWVRSGSQTLPKQISRTALRINDADKALGDNAGSLQVCFDN
jgi:hypothetical protein